MSGAPASTLSPAFTRGVKPAPFSVTVSMPMCISTSTPLAARRVSACAAAMQMHHFARARRAQGGVGGIDGKAVADELLREDRIGHAFERIDDAGERRGQDKHTVAHFA